MHTFIYILTFAVSILFLLSTIQSRPSFLLLLPIVIATIGIGWYLNKQIQKDHEASVQKGIEYTLDEQNAQHWMHQSFIPKTQLLFRNHMKELVIYCGLLLLAFIFFWSYLVVGLINAGTNTFVAFMLYATFVFYTLHADKWYRYFFNHIPKQYQPIRKNDWIHGYVILLPFTFLCFLIYIGTNYTGNILNAIIAIPVFFLVYTLVFVSLYCGIYLYSEYKKEEEISLNKEIKKATEEEV